MIDTDIFLSLLKAFLIGGAICAIGQILIDLTNLTPGKILVGFVVFGVFLGAVGVYEHIIDWAGTGATVPLTGFGNNLVEGTKKAVDEDGLAGVITGPLTAGAGGIMTAVLSGFIVSLLAKPKEKK